MSEGRIARRFAALRQQRRAGLVTFLTAGDPDFATSLAVLRRLPAAGADVIELGMPFSDPMADGPSIQASSLRALKSGQTMRKTLSIVTAFRQSDYETPIVLMGYYNPIYAYGVQSFVADAWQAGVDGLIVVDLPPEEADELVRPARAAGIDVIFLAAPTTTEERLPVVLTYATGFLYYVSITGVTGTASASGEAVERAVENLRRQTNLPVAVGFGIRTAEQAAGMARIADAAVVGSAIVTRIGRWVEDNAATAVAPGALVEDIAGFVEELARGVRGARKVAAAE